MTIRMAPSVLNADLTNLQAEVARVADAADWVHVDVMDGHFVPNLTLGLPVVERLAATSALPLDCHLMIEAPERWAPAYAEAGARSVTFHAEAASAPLRVAREIRAQGARAGLALNPTTSIEAYADLLVEFDMVLLMTIEPGFGGQPFLDAVLPKLRRTRALIDATDADIWLQVDGGVSAQTVERCVAAGADMLVAGTAVYGSPDPAEAVRGLRSAAHRAAGTATS